MTAIIHSLFYTTFFYIAGICAQHIHRQLLFLFLITAVIALLIFISIKNKKSSKQTLILSGFFFAAFILGLVRTHQQSHQEDSFFSTLSKTPVHVRATVTDMSTADHPRFSKVITLELHSFSLAGNNQSDWKSIQSKIRIYTNKRPRFDVGDLIELCDMEFKPIEKHSFATYLQKEGIATTLFISHLDYTLIHKPTFSIRRSIFKLKEKIFYSLRKKMSARSFQLFGSLFLGNKHAAPLKKNEQIKLHFNTWGVTHYLARSGLHLVLFIFLWNLLLSLIPIRYSFKQILLVALTALYFLLSWTSLPFIRALMTFILYRMCILSRVAPDFLYLLSLTCFILLLINPVQCLFLDFQLSFGLTAALSLFAHIKTHLRLQQHKTVAV
jgi:competence protein ComEC